MVTMMGEEVRAGLALRDGAGVRLVWFLAAALLVLAGFAAWRRLSQRRALGREIAERRRAAMLQDLHVRQVVRAGTEEEMRALAKEVCRRLTALGQGFERVAMLLRQPGGRVVVAGSVGMDDLSVRSLDGWSGGECCRRRKDDVPAVGTDPVEVRLDRRSGRGDGMSLMSCGSAMVLPMRASTGEMLGALAVGLPAAAGGWRRGLDEAPVRAMVERLGRDLEEVLRRTGGLTERKGVTAEDAGSEPRAARATVAAAPARWRRRSTEAGVNSRDRRARRVM